MNINLNSIEEAAKRLEGVAQKTPLQFSKRLSDQYGAQIYLKREDQQEVRSFKIRGAYNKIACLTADERKRGVVCASAGNHAQGVAYACAAMKINGVIFMPTVTPNQKIEKVKHFGGKFVTVKLHGGSYDDACSAAHTYSDEHNSVFVHAFDDEYTISGQGTIGKEIYEDLKGNFDIAIIPIGGGGIMAGIATYLKEKNKNITLIGVEATGGAGMYQSLKHGKVIPLEKVDTFVDGTAVKIVGSLTLPICQKYVKEVVTVPEGKVCTTMIELYQNEGIIAEPAGALSLAALDAVAHEIKGKTVVCILSGGNNDVLRYPEIMERSLVYQGRKHYFLIEFAQKPGQLKNFLNNVLGPNDDIALFEYIKKTNKEKGPALIGIELKDKSDYEPLLKRMEENEINYTKLKSDDLLYQYLI